MVPVLGRPRTTLRQMDVVLAADPIVGAATGIRPASRAAKRTVDLLAGVVLSLVTLPVVAVLAVGATVSFRATPFFVHERVGRWGRTFRMVKIRSLPVTAPTATDKYQLAAIANTRFGSWVRRTHLDELPQLWLVVAGSMSLVGPRPEMPHLAARFSDAQRVARDPFRPGCVGLWQNSEHNAGLMYETPEYDLVYAANQSFALDLYVLRTAARMEFGGGRLRLHDIPAKLVPNGSLTVARPDR